MNPLKYALFQALRAPTAAEGATGVFDKLATPGQVLPYVVVQLQSHKDDYAHDGRIIPESVWSFRVVDEGYSSARADRILEAIDRTFSALTNTIPAPGIRVRSMMREGEVDYMEVQGNRVFQHRAATYRIRATASQAAT